MTVGDSKRNGRVSATSKSPDNLHESHAPVGCFVTTPPPFTSESISLDMSPPKRRKLCKAPSPTPRVLFDEIFSSQLDLAHVLEDEFFLLRPKDTQATAPLQLVRPCAHRGSEPHSETPPSFACPTPPSLFITIDEDSEDDSDSEELTCFDMNSSCFSASRNLIEEEVINELTSHQRLSRIPYCTGRNSLDEGPDYNEPQTRLSERPRIRLKPRPVSL